MAHAIDAFEASFARVSCILCTMIAPTMTTTRAYPGDLLDHLRAFVALCATLERAERGAFAQTASALALDVSVLRRRMQTLATFVGARLLQGRGSRTQLTAAGARVRTHALRTLEAAAELVGAADADRGPLRVACTGTVLAELLPPAFRALQRAHGALTFRVRRAGAVAARELLERGEVDFAVLRDAARPAGVSAVRLAADRLWLASPRRSKTATARRLSFAALAREPLIGYAPGSSTMKRVMAVLGPHGAAPWIEVDGKAAALAYVAAGLGVAFVSAIASQRPERAGVTLRDVTGAFGPVSFWLVWRSEEQLSALHRRFVEELRRVAAPGATIVRDDRSATS
jgi:DNA-binding transcriptional LysR family regulator